MKLKKIYIKLKNHQKILKDEKNQLKKTKINPG
jgi:hypothetical protein